VIDLVDPPQEVTEPGVSLAVECFELNNGREHHLLESALTQFGAYRFDHRLCQPVAVG
jgi:hypothetical protein